MDINIEANPVPTLSVTLVGKKYEITPPKTALAMRLAVESKLYQDDSAKLADVLNVWIRKAFGEKGAEKIHKRLEADNEDDLLDITHVMALMEKVIEVQMDGDPTS